MSSRCAAPDKIGNAIARSYFSAPLAYSVLWDNNIEKIEALTADLSIERPWLDIEEEDIFFNSALKELRSDFGLLIKRLVINGLNFWYIGETRLKTIVLIILKLPILVLAVFNAITGLRSGKKKMWIFVIVILFYWIAHLPFAANGRLSVPVMPLAMFFALSNWRRELRNQAIA